MVGLIVNFCPKNNMNMNLQIFPTNPFRREENRGDLRLARPGLVNVVNVYITMLFSWVNQRTFDWAMASSSQTVTNYQRVYELYPH